MLVAAGASLGFPAAGAAHTDGYYARFRTTYRPAQAALGRVTKACACGAVTRVDQLPSCGARVAPFRKTVTRLLRFLTRTAPPARVKADVNRAIATTRVLQQRFTTLAAIIKDQDLARFKAIGGTGHPIDRAITAFSTTLGNLEIDLLSG